MNRLLKFTSLASVLGTLSLSGQMVILSETFDIASANWSVFGPAEAASSLNYNSTDGNPAGSYDLVAGPVAGPSFVAFRYEVSGLDFGVGPVTVSFDGKISSLMAAATHVRINGNFHGAIMGSFNDTTWTNWSQTYDLAQGFDGTDVLTIDFEFGLGAVDPSGGLWQIDNIEVSTIPEPSTYAALLGLVALGVIFVRRRKSRA